MPRLLELFDRHELTATWFWPGHSIETFPEQFDAVVAAGHEIGVHGYSHENPIAMSREQESDGPGPLHRSHRVAVRQPAHRLRRAVVGVQPGHQRAAARAGHQVRPLADAPRLRALLRPRRRLLDPDRLRPAAGRAWMKPLVRGEETDLVEIPANWYLDDLPPMMFIKASPNSHGFVNPRAHRADVARPVRLGLPRDATTPSSP